MSYGIVRVTWENNTFKRRWVTLPSGNPWLESEEGAEEMASAMTQVAREENIKGLAYRARRYEEGAFDGE